MGWMGGGAETPEASGQEKALARDAAVRFNDHQDNFVPLEDSFISQLSASEGESARLRGAGASDVAQAVKGGDQGAVGQANGQAGQGKTVMARAGLASASGVARGEAAAGGDAALRTKEMTGLAKMSAFGRGLQDMNSVALGKAASTASATAIDKLSNSVAGRGATYDAFGTAAGTAMGNIGSMQSLKEQLGKKYGSTTT